MSIRWPVEHAPAGAAIHQRNETRAAASPEAVWAWIVRPDRWSEFYDNALRIRHQDGPWPGLRLGSRFTWITFGAPVKTTVTEFESPYRLGWTGTGLGAAGHHAWLLERDDHGCRVITEETQRGLAPRLLAPALRPAMRHLHQRWVEGAARIAESGLRP